MKSVFNNISRKIAAVILMLFSMITFAQEKGNNTENDKETLGTETVVVVKAYTPAISDAFKVKSAPDLSDSLALAKKKVEYQINSIPVASTYTPAKGKAAAVDKVKKEKLYDNYATLGFGNYTSALAEFYSNVEVNRTDNFGVYLQHNSSQGGIDGVKLDNQYYDTDLNLNFTSRQRDMTYGFDLGLAHQVYNWYGLPSDLILTEEQINGIDPLQTYLGVALGGKLRFEDGFFKEVNARFRHFRDVYDSSENHFVAKPVFEFPVGDEIATGRVILDYISGSFDRDFEETLGIKNQYSFFNVGFHPSFVILKDNLTLNLGAAAYYSIDSQNSKNSFFIYPKVTASYRLLEEYVIAYAGLEGDLIQNTYHNAVQVNPFVSPNLAITPTDQQYDGYAGIKGRFTNTIGYNIRAGYRAEQNKPLFLRNLTAITTPDATEDYDYGNSFGYVYDDVNTLSASGELNFDINRNFQLGIKGTFFSYDSRKQEEAWNLPQLKASVTMNYQITAQWYLDTQLYFIGERKALFNPVITTLASQTVTLDPYFDANLALGYRFNDRLSFFVKGNNLAGENYQKWLDYPVLGLQVLGGVTYKFDF